MASERNSVSTDHLIEQYLAGKTRKQIADENGLQVATVVARLRRAGHASRTCKTRRAEFDLAEAIKLYKEGVGLSGVGQRLGVPRDAVGVALREAGLPLRGRGEQQAVRMKLTTKRERKALTAAANAASRGRVMPFDTLCQMAATRERNLSCQSSPYEAELFDMLAERGIVGARQKAIGPYNCDFAANPVAVEVWGGNYHWYGPHRSRCEDRFRYMRDAGWRVLAIAVVKSFPLTPAVADYVATYVEQARRDPSSVSEYRVIWGAGEFTTGGCLDDDNFTIEPPFTSARDRASGQYKRVPREA